MFFTPVMHRSAYIASPRVVDTRLERWLNDTLATPGACATRADVAQDDTTYTITVDLPGVRKDQLTIGIEGQALRIETVADAPRRYKLAYELAQELDAANSKAVLELGVLTLTLAKHLPVSKVTQLPIA
jgi:HSP20 family molecular chaperone IbpA